MFLGMAVDADQAAAGGGLLYWTDGGAAVRAASTMGHGPRVVVAQPASCARFRPWLT